MTLRADLIPYLPHLSRIFQKTIEHHGNPANLWGTSPDSDRPICEYSAGCAIGLSLTPKTARMADEARYGSIRMLLGSASSDAEQVLQDLFDTTSVPAEVVIILALLQRYHDTLATNQELKYPRSDAIRRAIYVHKVKRLARYANIPLNEPRTLEQLEHLP